MPWIASVTIRSADAVDLRHVIMGKHLADNLHTDLSLSNSPLYVHFGGAPFIWINDTYMDDFRPCCTKKFEEKINHTHFKSKNQILKTCH